jgi:hypothetical protein
MGAVRFIFFPEGAVKIGFSIYILFYFFEIIHFILLSFGFVRGISTFCLDTKSGAKKSSRFEMENSVI